MTGLLLFGKMWSVPLSAEELAMGKKAYYEVRGYNSSRISFFIGAGVIVGSIVLFGLGVASGMAVVDQGRNLRGWVAFLSIFSFFSHAWVFLFVIGIQGITYFRLKSRHLENLKIISDLEKRHTGELPFGLESEVEKVTATERKPLLWRLDAFLSRKG